MSLKTHPQKKGLECLNWVSDSVMSTFMERLDKDHRSSTHLSAGTASDWDLFFSFFPPQSYLGSLPQCQRD